MTGNKQRHYDEDGESYSRKLKHSRNRKGEGMRVLNTYNEEHYDEQDLDYDFELYDEDDNTNTN